MKFIISGCHGSGKTTLCKQLNKRFTDYKYLKEGIADWVKEYDLQINEQCNFDDQKKLLDLKTQQIDNAPLYSIIDRFEGDFITYSYANELIDRDQFFEHVSVLIHKYKFIEKDTYFVCTLPQKQYLTEENEIRCLDFNFQKKMKGYFDLFFNAFIKDSKELESRSLTDVYCSGENKPIFKWILEKMNANKHSQRRKKIVS